MTRTVSLASFSSPVLGITCGTKRKSFIKKRPVSACLMSPGIIPRKPLEYYYSFLFVVIFFQPYERADKFQEALIIHDKVSGLQS